MELYIVSRALDHEKAVSDRSPVYSDERLERVKEAFAALFKDRNPALERKYVELYLTRAYALPEALKIDYLDAEVASKAGDARQAAISEYARRLVEDQGDIESINKLFTLDVAQLRALNSPTVNFALRAATDIDQMRKQEQDFNNSITRLRALYIEGMTGFKKSLFYPDANSTLRFTYGEVSGYNPRDGVHYNYVTSLSGVIAKDTGKEPFDVPSDLKKLYANHNYAPYDDQKIHDVPVAFLTTNDITGGNSGSPVLNGKGEMIGVAFDGNYEGLGSDYVYNPDQSRTICVDIRYVLFLAEKMAGDSHLFQELDLHSKTAAKSKTVSAR
jgi:hypothetical protein